MPTPDFRALLEAEHDWPAAFTFKFVVPAGEVQKAEALVAAGEVTRRESSSGRYVSVTVRARMQSAEAVLEVYERAARIPGMIAL